MRTLYKPKVRVLFHISYKIPVEFCKPDSDNLWSTLIIVAVVGERAASAGSNLVGDTDG